MSFETKETYSKKLLSESKNKCIVFANTQKQADSLCKYSYHSSNKNSDDNLVLFKTGKIQRLSCVNQLSEGVTIPDLKEAIILHSYGGSSAKTKQRIGRVLRLNPDDKAIVHILCYGNTIDENWVKDALSDLDQKKIRYITVNQLLLNI
jgi:superfamily II DNA or RNA helicase